MSDEKKIIIDEDWKSQVQAEKEAAKHPAGESAVVEAAKGDALPVGDGQQDFPMPPASFEMLISTLATEALVAMGQVPHPATGKAELRRNQAQYLIDMLDVLRQKSQGNLTPAEQQLLEDVLHQLRMVFVAVANSESASA